MFFSKKSKTEPATQEWIFESAIWAVENEITTKQSVLLEPTRAFFDIPKGDSPAIAQQVLDACMEHMRMEGSIVHLQTLNKLPADFRHEYGVLQEIGGTYQRNGDEGLITYDPEQMVYRLNFIATMAHELMHHRLFGIDEYPPGGEELEELSTDLQSIFAGFGIFQIVGAESMGWSGYLRQPTRIFALAVYVEMLCLDADLVASFLPKRIARALHHEIGLMDRHVDIIHNLRGRLGKG